MNIVYDSRMAKVAAYWLALVLCFNIYVSCLVRAFPQRSIIRAKRDLEDKEVIGDALYDKGSVVSFEGEQKLSKRETEDATKSASESGDNKDEEKSADSAAKEGEKSDADKSDSEAKSELSSNASGDDANDEAKKQPAEDVKGDTRHNVEGKNLNNEKDKIFKNGMDSNVDQPMTNSDLIKKYKAEEDTSNGEMLGLKKRTEITKNTATVQKPTDTNSDVITADTKRSNIQYSDSRFRRTQETHDIQEGGAPSHFQVDDKSADLEINANSAGVKVKAKPASLQVVSRPGQHGTAPMMPFIPPPVPVLHHMPHHHRHHRHHHHHRRHHHPNFFYYPAPHHEEFIPFHNIERHEPYFGEAHFYAPYHHQEFEYGADRPHWGGEGFDDGYHLYGRNRMGGDGPMYGRSLYGRSTVETTNDPRMTTPAALDGFNSGVALPDMDQRFMTVRHMDRPQEKYENLDDGYSGSNPMFGPPEGEHEQGPESGDYRYHVPKAAYHEPELPHVKGHKRRFSPEVSFQDYVPQSSR